MKDADPAARQVVPSPERVEEPGARSELERHGVDREVAAREIRPDRGAGRDAGSAPGCEYVSAARAGDVEPPAARKLERRRRRIARCTAGVAPSRAASARRTSTPSPSTTRSTSRTGRRRRRSRTAPPTSAERASLRSRASARGRAHGAPRPPPAETPADGALVEDVLDRVLPRQGPDLARQPGRGRDADRVGGLQARLELPRPDEADRDRRRARDDDARLSCAGARGRPRRRAPG